MPTRVSVSPYGPVLALLVAVAAVTVGGPAAPVVAAAVVDHPVSAAPTTPTDDDERPTRPTINEFFPEERPLSDCLSSLPKPNCGSSARGGRSQLLVLGAIVGGLSFIAWRIVASARRGRRSTRPDHPG